MPTKPIKPQGGSHHKKPQYTKEAKAVTTGQGHQGPSGPEFIPIHRDWTAFKYDDFPFAGAIGQAQYSTVDAASNAAMQRWKAEAMRNQPFHTIEAVALLETKSAGQNESESQRSGSNVGYLAD
ncbi:uncharacterized protein PAC_12362 [Phialocephala subalpina]|uniref:Uncharacterized protein n=1 Tax=Phialocephala subalpina TaxID=576137 RepID=A0A1L7XBT2_9HELO|nr:uncharacterized protein PAC_12362 [Phialocephala subalpina]